MKEEEFFGLVRPEFRDDPKIEITHCPTYTRSCPCCDKTPEARCYDKIYSSGGLSVFVELELVQFNSLTPSIFRKGIVTQQEVKQEKGKYNREYKKGWRGFYKGKGFKKIPKDITSIFQQAEEESRGGKAGPSIMGGIPLYPGLPQSYKVSGVLVDSNEDIEMSSANVVSAHAQFDPFFETAYHLGRFNHPRDQEYLNAVLMGGSINREVKNVWNLCFNDLMGRSFLEGKLGDDSFEVVLGREIGLASIVQDVRILQEIGEEITKRLME